MKSAIVRFGTMTLTSRLEGPPASDQQASFLYQAVSYAAVSSHVTKQMSNVMTECKLGVQEQRYILSPVTEVETRLRTRQWDVGANATAICTSKKYQARITLYMPFRGCACPKNPFRAKSKLHKELLLPPNR
jgi:hypothetical protein